MFAALFVELSVSISLRRPVPRYKLYAISRIPSDQGNIVAVDILLALLKCANNSCTPSSVEVALHVRVHMMCV